MNHTLRARKLPDGRMIEYSRTGNGAQPPTSMLPEKFQLILSSAGTPAHDIDRTMARLAESGAVEISRRKNHSKFWAMTLW